MKHNIGEFLFATLKTFAEPISGVRVGGGQGGILWIKPDFFSIKIVNFSDILAVRNVKSLTF